MEWACLSTLWAVQAVLAVVFVASGAVKLTMSKERLIATGHTGVAPFALPVIQVTAAGELLAAAGLILPGLVGVATILTPLAAAGLMIVMIGAAISHTVLREYPQVGVNVVLFALALFVAVAHL